MNPALIKIAAKRQAMRSAAGLRNGAVDFIASIPQKLKSGFDDGMSIASDRWGRGNSILDPAAARQSFNAISDPAEAVGHVAGRVAADLGGNGTRSAIWANRHPQKFLGNIVKDGIGSLGGSGSSRLLAAGTAAGVLGATSGNFNIGSFLASPSEMGRTPGFKAVLPSDDDPTKTSAPVREVAARYLLGYKGRPLPFKEFVAETGMAPDDAKEYLRWEYRDKGIDGVGLIKGTMNGLNNEPEVKIAGYRVPLSAAATTGLAVGGLMGYAANKDAIDAISHNVIDKPLQKAGAAISNAVQPIRNAGASVVDNAVGSVLPSLNKASALISPYRQQIKAGGRLAGIAGLAAAGIYGGAKAVDYLKEQHRLNNTEIN